MCVYDDVTPGV